MPQMVIKLPVNSMSLTPIKMLESFESTMEKIFEEKPYLADYAKAIDAKSTVTFNHSINVALLTYVELNKDSNFTQEDIKKYTAAAFAHDVGKLTTPDEILHAGKEVDMQQKYNGKESKIDIMMRHSIDGYDVAKAYGFNKEEIAAGITHHIADSALEAGQDGNYKGATESRRSWNLSYGEGYIESILKDELSWATDKDIKALEVISFTDVIESLRDKSRPYKLQNEWNEINADGKQSVVDVVDFDTKSKKMNPIFADNVMSQEFRDNTDFYISAGSPQRMREFIAEKTNDKESMYVFSATKVNDILANPEVGIMFVKDINGQTSIDLGHGQILDIGKKEILSFEEVSLKNTDIKNSDFGAIEENNDIIEHDE